MAETNARREARRRRILENSESRLRRITGRVSPDGTNDNLQVESNSPKTDLNFEEDNIINGICNIPTINTTSNITTSNTTLQDYMRFNDKHENFLNDINDKNVSLPEEQPSKTKFMLYTLLLHRINFVLLAGIVNILLVLKLGNLFGEAIIIPCLLLMMGRLCNYTTLYETRDGSLLVATLMLCNIKPRLIYIFKVSCTLFTIILNDFCLYMFSFILMRYGIIRYYYYYNPIVSRNV